MPPGELPKTLLARLCSTIAQRLITSYIVGEVIHLSSCSLVDPHLDYHWMVTSNWEEVSASLTSDGRHRLHIQRECYRAYLDEEMSLQQKRREMHKSRPFRVWSSGEWCWFWRSRALCIDEPRPVVSSKRVRSWVHSASTLTRT